MTATAPQAKLALRNILIATDFSSCSERALLHAVATAHHFGSTLHLVHVVPPVALSMLPPDAYMGGPEAAVLSAEIARSNAQHRLAEVLHRTHCDDVKYRIWAPLGQVSEMLCAIVRREHIDLAVVGTHGKTGLRRIVLGSVAEDVFRHACCPVLTVGPHSWRSDPPSIRVKHVLFPTDLSADSANALPFVMATAAEFGAKLTMMHVVEHLDPEAAHDRSRVIAVLEQKMHEMVEASGPLPPQTEFQVKFGDIADSVIEAATRLEVDLVAFGLKAPDSYVDRLPWMHAYKVVCEVACPVLSLRSASTNW